MCVSNPICIYVSKLQETVIGPISLQDQNIDQINAINSELHIGTVHKNIFHFHGNVKPPSKTNGETQQNGGVGDEPHHLSGKYLNIAIQAD